MYAPYRVLKPPARSKPGVPVLSCVFYAAAASLDMMIEPRRVYCMDVMDFLDACKASGAKADAIITDPPYAISSNVVIARNDTTDIVLDFGSWDKFDGDDSFFKWTFAWVDKADEILRPGGIFVSFFDRDKVNFLARYLIRAHNYKRKNYFAWTKSNPAIQFRKVKWSVGWEEAIVMQKPSGYDPATKEWLYGDLTYNHQLGQQPDYYTTSVISGHERFEATVTVKGKDGRPEKDDKGRIKKIRHPTQKPVDLLSLFITYWTNPGDLVVDPFCGVGSAPVACELNRRKWMANDGSKTWSRIAKRRLEKYVNQGRLDDFIAK